MCVCLENLSLHACRINVDVCVEKETSLKLMLDLVKQKVQLCAGESGERERVREGFIYR